MKPGIYSHVSKVLTEMGVAFAMSFARHALCLQVPAVPSCTLHALTTHMIEPQCSTDQPRA